MKKKSLINQLATGAWVAAVLGLLSTSAAHAQIFVANSADGTVSEYNLDGTSVTSDLISGLSGLQGIAVSGSDLYVDYGGTIGEYTLGSSPGSITSYNASLISGLGSSYDVLASGSDLFVTTSTGVAEYNTSGTELSGGGSGNLINVSGAQALTLSGSDLYVATSSGTIGEYTLGLTPGTINSNPLLSSPSLITVTHANFVGIGVSGSDIFVTNNNIPAVGEYTTSGDTTNASLISGAGFSAPRGLDLVGTQLFVASDVPGKIGEYNLDGTAVASTLISDPNEGPWGVAVRSVPEPSTWVLMLGGLTCLIGLQRFARKV